MRHILFLFLGLSITCSSFAGSKARGIVEYIEDEYLIIQGQKYAISNEVEVVSGRIVEEPLPLPAIPNGAEVIIYQEQSVDKKDTVVKIQMIGPSYLIREARENLP